MLNPDPTNAEEIPVSASAFLSLMSLYSVAGQVVKAISKPSVAMSPPFRPEPHNSETVAYCGILLLCFPIIDIDLPHYIFG